MDFSLSSEQTNDFKIAYRVYSFNDTILIHVRKILKSTAGYRSENGKLFAASRLVNAAI